MLKRETEIEIALFSIIKFCTGWSAGWTGSDINATSDPKLSTDIQFSSIELIIWGQMWQYVFEIFEIWDFNIAIYKIKYNFSFKSIEVS